MIKSKIITVNTDNIKKILKSASKKQFNQTHQAHAAPPPPCPLTISAMRLCGRGP